MAKLEIPVRGAAKSKMDEKENRLMSFSKIPSLNIFPTTEDESTHSTI